VHSAFVVGLLRANTTGCLLKDAMSRRISGVKTPPTAAAPVNKLLITDCVFEGEIYRVNKWLYVSNQPKVHDQMGGACSMHW